MAFGGYKFAGYRVDNTEYVTSITRCLAIHAARVRAFLNASSAAGTPWAADPAWSTGTIDLDPATGAIQSGAADGIIIEQTGLDGNVHGYLTCFKYSNVINGYYAILTTDDYHIGVGGSGVTGLLLNPDSCIRYTEYSDLYAGPIYASCLHCLSLDPFGHAPSGEAGKDCWYLVDSNSRSMRLKSIGYNIALSSSYLPDYSYSGGFVTSNSDISHFGYVIRDKDITVISAAAPKSSYANPFYSGILDTHVTVMSLDGFSELYGKDDAYKFLEFELCNNYYDSGSGGDETKCNLLQGWHHQILNSDGRAMVDNTERYDSHPVVRVLMDVRTFYNPSGANYAPFMGIPLYCSYGYVSGTQGFKGSTNPELLASNCTSQSLAYAPYSQAIDGSLLFIRNVDSSGNVHGQTWFPSNGSSENMSADSVITGYCNLYIGWDVQNPDLKTDAAWPEYTPAVPD